MRTNEIKTKTKPSTSLATRYIIRFNPESIYLFINSLFNVDDIFIKYKLKILVAVQRACMLINVNHTKYLYLKTFYKIN